MDGLELKKARIDGQIAERRAMLGGGPAIFVAKPEAAPKREISAAARRRMALGQQKRWAAIKSRAESPSPATTEPPKLKQKLSAAERTAIVAALKKRWAAKKASGKAKATVTKKAVAKKTAPKKTTAKSTLEESCEGTGTNLTLRKVTDLPYALNYL